MFIRVASKSDARSIYDIHTSAIKEICAKYYSEEATKAWITRQYVGRYLKPIEKEEIFVVVDGTVKDGDQLQQVTGFGHLSNQFDDESHINVTSEQGLWYEIYC